ncbi:MAG: NAD(P)/FAD-dependent oxidoreductase [Saprospiraceae bacterium]|nr:NAD(P)/FAD-dependent oxidoreductase [Saprospiraceae bacterium]
MNKKYDIVIIGSGPNGLSAGIYLVQKGLKVLIIEASATVGGGTRTAELTLPGFHHDVCSAVHPMGVLSPYFQQLDLEQYGLEWVYPNVSVAHPLDKEDAVILSKSVVQTASNLGKDAEVYNRLIQPLASRIDWLLEDILKPLGIPKHPIFLANFGLKAGLPSTIFNKLFFKENRAKALFAGCAGHSVLPLENWFTSALGLVFLASGHAVDWPIAKGGSQSIADALLNCFQVDGGEIVFSKHVKSMKELPPSKAYLFDTDPLQVATIAETELPKRYVKRLRKYNFGMGTFKIDYALSEAIPWRDKRCLEASTVHLGGCHEEIAESERAAWHGKHSDSPFVILAQQSQFDKTRSPKGQHTCWANCHVPLGSERDMSLEIENQIERFAPGFRDIILAKSSMTAHSFSKYNLNYVGGAVTGGAADITQLFTRPVARLNPYSTPNPKIFMCSASTPPGGGVHGMCGYWAAKSVFKKL